MKPEGCLMETSEKTLVTGRRLDGDGNPIDGTGFEYAAEGPIAEVLAARIGPLYSNPDFGEWGVKLVESAERFRFATVYQAGHLGVAEHFHPRYEEYLEVLQGEFRFMIDGEERLLNTGDKLDIPRGVRHGFRFAGTGYGSLLIESVPPGRLPQFLPILVGLGQKGKLTRTGRPPLLQALAMAHALEDDTVYTFPPPVLMRPLARLVGPQVNRFGSRRDHQRYLSDEFWEQRVEQP